MKIQEILERLDILGKMMYEKFGTDSYEARCYLHDTKELINQGQTLPINRNASDFNVKLMYGDGFLGRNYYMFVNEVKIDICNNNGDFNIAKEKTLSILKALNIQYQGEIKFEHDGCL
jgi:hypothetical protein